MLWSFLLFSTVLFKSTKSLKYDFIAIKSSDNELPSFIPSNVRFLNDKLRINTIEKDATFLTIIKPKSTPFSVYFKNNETSTKCISNFWLQFGGYPNVKVAVDCEQGYSWLHIGEKSSEKIKNTGKECFANITLNSKMATISYSGKQEKLVLDKFDIEQNFEGSNMSIISFAIWATVQQDPDSTCVPYIEFGSEHYLSAFQPFSEIITTTTTTTAPTTTTKKPITVSRTTKARDTVAETSSNNGPILWILIFIFSGTFAGAAGGVAMFFFLRYREKRLQKKKLLQKSDDDNELHTAKERLQTPPNSKKSVASHPPSLPSKAATIKNSAAAKKTAKSQPSKV